MYCIYNARISTQSSAIIYSEQVLIENFVMRTFYGKHFFFVAYFYIFPESHVNVAYFPISILIGVFQTRQLRKYFNKKKKNNFFMRGH